MKRTTSLTILLVFLYSYTYAQTKIEGLITFNGDLPIANANVLIEGTYDGTTSSTDGHYTFITDQTGTLRIKIRADGYKEKEHTIEVEDSLMVLDIELETQGYQAVTLQNLQILDDVIIQPKPFESSDKNKVTVLNTLDILTTATDGNINSALKTLPGAQQVGESGGLFIRGGEGYETQTFIDGMLVSNFNYSSPAGQAARSRFPPGLFKGTFFSSGGYSALYGQALSSTLILESEDLPQQSSADVSITPIFIGAGGERLAKDKKSSFGGNVTYTNLQPTFSLLKTSIDFVKKPEYLDGNVSFRKKLTRGGMLKFYGSFGVSDVSFEQLNLNDPKSRQQLGLSNNNLYTNFTYKQFLLGWKVNAGVSYSRNVDNTSLSTKTVSEQANRLGLEAQSSLMQFRTVFTRRLFAGSNLHLGGELHQTEEQQQIKTLSSITAYNDRYTALFAEADMYITNQLSARVGARFEHSSLLGKSNIAPRASLGYTLKDDNLFSLSYGQFYQKGQSNFLLYNRDIGFTKATHYIASFQKVKNDHTFRAELFHKQYNNLVKTVPDTTNSGSGYARGLELFWRDKKTIKNVDYWISYSYLDTKREYLSYPIAAQPHYAADHTFSLVLKRFFPSISTNISTSYSFATGRPYFNPNRTSENFMDDRTIDYHNLGVSLAYLPKIGKTFSVVVLTLSNVLGNEQVFGYNYSNTDYSIREAIRPVNNPFVFLGLFINFGIDRTEDIINSNL